MSGRYFAWPRASVVTKSGGMCERRSRVPPSPSGTTYDKMNFGWRFGCETKTGAVGGGDGGGGGRAGGSREGGQLSAAIGRRRATDSWRDEIKLLRLRSKLSARASTAPHETTAHAASSTRAEQPTHAPFDAILKAESGRWLMTKNIAFYRLSAPDKNIPKSLADQVCIDISRSHLYWHY